MKKNKFLILFILIMLLINILLYNFYEIKAENTEFKNQTPTVSYRTHVQDIGWQKYENNGNLAGTTGESLRLEAMNIKLLNNNKINIKYQVHVQDIGWQDWKENDELAGTEGKALRLEAIKIKLENTEDYSIMYRVHIENIGWQDWKKDGEMAGTEGKSLRLEAIEIKIIENENKQETKEEEKIQEKIKSLQYVGHVQNIGWQEWQKDGAVVGTTGQSLNMEALKIKLENYEFTVHIKYKAHVQDIGWQDWKKDGEIAGTTGLGKRIEAIQIELEGLEGYTIEFRAHVQNKGWQPWGSNGMTVGTVGQSLGIEALQIRIIKNEETVVPQIQYSSYNSQNKWISYVKNGQTSGTEKSALKIEALRIKLSNIESGSIKYSAHIQNVGWIDYLQDNKQAGTPESGNGIEAIKIKLEGMDEYSVEYRVYINGKGWQEWVCDDEIAGTTGENKQISAIQIRLNIKTYVKKKGIDLSFLDSSKYPGYKNLIEKLVENHPNWNFEFLYTGLKFSDAVYGEYSNHSSNLVETNVGDWVCSVCGSKQYYTGWYGASDKAIAYYMDPRNFLNESNIFQFLDVNEYNDESVSFSGINSRVSNTFLASYANDINTACKNTNTNPYYVIARLFQENGTKGSATSKGMDGGDGKLYYNPFNINANGSDVVGNALKKAKAEGWDSMEKAIEGGIAFLKKNWLDNYQNTLYQNKFDIDSTNGSSLYSHQYMQNLLAAYSEAKTLKSCYDTNTLESTFTFIIPLYEEMSSNISPMPSNQAGVEEYPINVVVNTESGTLALRSEASVYSSVITRLPKGTTLLSIKRGVNSSWQEVVTKDGTIGYMSGEYLRQIDDEIICNYKGYIKTDYSGGVSVRTGPSNKSSAGFSKIEYLKDYTNVTVIDDFTYQGYEGSDWVQWARIILDDGRQAFVPAKYIKK